MKSETTKILERALGRVMQGWTKGTLRRKTKAGYSYCLLGSICSDSHLDDIYSGKLMFASEYSGKLMFASEIVPPIAWSFLCAE